VIEIIAATVFARASISGDREDVALPHGRILRLYGPDTDTDYIELDNSNLKAIWRHEIDGSGMGADRLVVVQNRCAVVLQGGGVLGVSGRIDQATAKDWYDSLGDDDFSGWCYRISDGKTLWHLSYMLIGIPAVGGPGDSIWSMVPHPSPRHPYFMIVRRNATTGKLQDAWRMPRYLLGKPPELFDLGGEYRYRAIVKADTLEIIGKSTDKDVPAIDLKWNTKSDSLSIRRSSKAPWRLLPCSSFELANQHPS
jgi:hypothetical protein